MRWIIRSSTGLKPDSAPERRGPTKTWPIDHRDLRVHEEVHWARAYGSTRDMVQIATSSARRQYLTVSAIVEVHQCWAASPNCRVGLQKLHVETVGINDVETGAGTMQESTITIAVAKSG